MSFQIILHDGIYQCTKEFSLAATSCPDWSTLVWGTNTDTTLGGAVNFFNDGADHSTWTQYSDSPGTPGSFAELIKEAAFDYDGTGCDCNLELTITEITSQPPPFTVCEITIQDQTQTYVAFAKPPSVPGTYNYPFTLLDGSVVARNMLITSRTATAFAGGPALGQLKIQAVCAITNVGP